MTPDRLRYCLRTIKQLGPTSLREMAAILQINERRMRRMCKSVQDDSNSIPLVVEAWIEELTAFFETPEMMALVAEYDARLDAFFEKHPIPDSGRGIEAEVIYD